MKASPARKETAAAETAMATTGLAPTLSAREEPLLVESSVRMWSDFCHLVQLSRSERRSDDATLLDKSADGILFIAVACRGNFHGFRRAQTLPLPLKAAANAPGQNTLTLGPQLVWQSFVLLIGGYRDGERNQPNSSPYCMVGSTDDRLVIRAENQLMRRLKLPKILPHAPGSNFFAAG